MNKRPNFLFIMADQFRTRSMTGLGDGIETPNIDRIRRMAVHFTRGACTAPLCTPSRASLATGKMPSHCGVMEHDTDLPKDQVTYYQLLRRAGYRVAVSGKTDLHKTGRYLGQSPLPIIYHLGFTESLETEGKMNSAWYYQDERGRRPSGLYQKFLAQTDPGALDKLNADYLDRLRSKPVYYAAPSVLPADEFLDAFIGRNACEYLEQVDEDAPWHFFVSFAGPHNPWDPPAEELEKLGDKRYPATPHDTLEGKPNWVKKRARRCEGMTEDDLNNTKRHYDGAIQVIDRWVGRMLDVLERRGLMENTVIIFAADHGEMMGEHRMFAKTTMYEGALRVPLLIHLPGMDAPRTDAAPAMLMDLAPTILDLAGVEYDRSLMDARTLAPLLRGEADPLRPAQVSELRDVMMVCTDRYKWIRSWNDAPELYDLQADPDELHNLAPEHPEIIKQLMKYTFAH